MGRRARLHRVPWRPEYRSSRPAVRSGGREHKEQGQHPDEQVRVAAEHGHAPEQPLGRGARPRQDQRVRGAQSATAAGAAGHTSIEIVQYAKERGVNSVSDSHGGASSGCRRITCG